jgi:hypothetical protein
MKAFGVDSFCLPIFNLRKARTLKLYIQHLRGLYCQNRYEPALNKPSLAAKSSGLCLALLLVH